MKIKMMAKQTSRWT